MERVEGYHKIRFAFIGKCVSPIFPANNIMAKENRIYEASPRHCEPVTAQNPGVKCPRMTISVAQGILCSAEPVGKSLQATYEGVAYVARKTRTTDDGEVWHGYPEAWDKIRLQVEETLVGTRSHQAQRYSKIR